MIGSKVTACQQNPSQSRRFAAFIAPVHFSVGPSVTQPFIRALSSFYSEIGKSSIARDVIE
jgi:hypothetical protein